MKTKQKIFLPFIIITLYLISCHHGRNPEVTVKELQNHIKYLSSDLLLGRETGSDGDSLAAVYIMTELASYGLKPLSADGYQRFNVIKRAIPGSGNYIEINGKSCNPENEFIPASFSSNSALESEVSFAGYGFSINHDSLQWDDYRGIDVKGKWVMLLRADPESEDNNSIFIPFSGDRDKALLARDMGAGGVLLVSGPSFDPLDNLESISSGDFSVDIPVIRIKREVADVILSKSNTSVAYLESKLNETRRPNSFPAKMTINGRSEIIKEFAGTRNVVMLLPGEDDKLKDEYIILGAHFDHLGYGGPGSSSRAADTSGIHYGADDNASGVAMMLELAQKFASTKSSHKRSIVCIAFSGEEEGLLGSKHFTDKPLIDLSKVNVMINLDMVGRLNDSNTLFISGLGTAAGLKELVNSKSDTTKINLAMSDEGYGPSDHSSFYGKDIPVLFYFTGAHLDYHTPSDTYDKINYNGMVKISDLIFSVAREINSTESRLSFKESGPKAGSDRISRRKGVTLGIMPDFAGLVKNGLRADFVTPGKPAALGGMRKGDIITSINGKSVNNIQDYMSRMSQLKHGQTISVEVLRNENTEVLLIQL